MHDKHCFKIYVIKSVRTITLTCIIITYKCLCMILNNIPSGKLT